MAAIDISQPIFWRKFNVIKDSIKTADLQTANELLQQLDDLNTEYSTMKSDIERVRALQSKYKYSHTPKARAFTKDTIDPRIRVFETFPNDYAKLRSVIQKRIADLSMKNGGRRTRKKKQMKRRTRRTTRR